jgi:hypothetical protein
MKLGDPGPWLTIVWDELPLCVGRLARRMIIDLLSAGRPRKMRVLGGSNSETVKAIAIEGCDHAVSESRQLLRTHSAHWRTFCPEGSIRAAK